MLNTALKEIINRRFSVGSLALPFSERRMLLFVGDVLGLLLAGLITLWGQSFLRYGLMLSLNVSANQVLWLGLLVLTWIVLAVINEGYDLQVASRRRQIVLRLLLTTGAAGLLYLLAFFAFGRPAALFSAVPDQQRSLIGVYIPPRIIPIAFLLTSLPMVVLWRISYIQLFTNPRLRRRTIIIGAGKAGRALVRSMQQTLKEYEIIGFIDDDPAKQGTLVEGVPVLGNRDDLLRLVRVTQVNEVTLAITHDVHSDLFRVLMDCYERGIAVRPMPLLCEEALGQVPVEHLGQKWFQVPFSASAPTLYRSFKRLIDIVAALVGLICLGIIFPCIALIIYLDSPGPIFYRQERLGKGGRIFRLIKFRSMIPNAEQRGQAVWATRADPRITRVGHVLRRTRLDELPQVLNVLTGDMSIVGPRPERPQFVNQLQEQIPFYRARLSVKPGLTGWAQVKYRYGSTVEDALMKLQYDLYYIKHQSLVLDLLIILRTVRVVLGFKGT